MTDNGHRPPTARDIRCSNCGRLWFRAILPCGSRIEIRCPKCGHMAHLHVDDDGLAIMTGPSEWSVLITS